MEKLELSFMMKMALPKMVAFIKAYQDAGKVKITIEESEKKDKFIIETDKLPEVTMQQIREALDGKVKL
jgi:hypothetical protein